MARYLPEILGLLNLFSMSRVLTGTQVTSHGVMRLVSNEILHKLFSPDLGQYFISTINRTKVESQHQALFAEARSSRRRK
jgi:hypothetical protein